MFYRVNPDICTGCGSCAEDCIQGAIALDEERGVAVIDLEDCIGCMECFDACLVDAIEEF